MRNSVSDMTEVYLIAGALLMSAALVLAFIRPVAGVVASYAGAWAMRASGYAPLSSTALMFWAVAVLLVISINMARREPFEAPARFRAFIVGGSLAGMAVSLAMVWNGVVAGAAIGAVLGAVAYMGVNRSRDFAAAGRTLVALGLPTVVTMSLTGLALRGLIAAAG